MPAPSDFPCPNCQQDLLLDEDTAGREVACPYCHERVLLPTLEAAEKAANPNPAAVPLKPILPQRRDKVIEIPPLSAPPVEQLTLSLDPAPEDKRRGQKGNLPAAKNNRSPLPAPKSPPAPEESADSSAQPRPQPKTRTPEEELRRLAAMAGSVDYDHEKFEKKGMIAFGCPLCQRPLWVPKKDAGKVITCEGCSSEVVAPNPQLGLPAQLVDPTQETPVQQTPVRKTVLPESRKTPDATENRAGAGGKGKSGSSPTEEARKAPLPKPKIDQPQHTSVADAPAAGNAPVALPSERISQARTVGAKRAAEPIEAEPEPPPTPVAVPAPAPAQEAKRPRGAVRLNNERRVFAPQKEVSGDLETTESWGQVETKAPVSKRYALIGYLLLIPIVLGVIFYALNANFSKKVDADPALKNEQKNDKNEARIVHVAEEVLNKFFEARTLEDMAKYVRHPEKTLPRMQSFYKRPLPKYKFVSFVDAKVGLLEDVDFITGILTLDGEKPRSVALEVPPETSPNPDDLRIDWESLVYWSEVSADQFLSQQMEKGVDFRVSLVLQNGDYWVEPYDDQSRWVCFKIYFPGTTADENSYCYGYVEADSEVATQMIQPIRRAAEMGQQSMNAILRLRFRPEARRKNMVLQVSIEKFYSGWLIPRE